MAAPKANSYWQLAQYPGRPKKFESAEDLWNKCIEYFKWCDSNPWHKNEAVKSGDLAGEIIKVPTQRPYLLSGLQIHLGIDEQTWINYRTKEGYEDFFEVIKACEEIIRTQKLEGAMVGAFNANIVARDLGLKDNVSNEHTGANGAPLVPPTIQIIKPKE